MASLQRLFAWYQEARIVTQSVRGVLDTDLARGQEQTAQRALQRAFDTARARAAVLAPERRAGSQDTPLQARRAERRAQLQAALQQDERDVARLQARLRTAPAAMRPGVERELAAAGNRRELKRVQLDFVTKLGQFDAAAPGQDDLAHQIQTLQDSVPELSTPNAAPTVVTTAPRAGAPSGGSALIYRLLALEHSRRSLRELRRATTQLLEDTDAEVHVTQQSVRPLVARLRALADGPGANGTSPATDQQEFRALLERAKLLGAVMLPLREQSALLRRYATDLKGWTRAIDHEVWEALRGLLIQLVGVALALAAIFGGSVVWRIAVTRYVANVYHRRLLLTARHVVVAAAVALVLVFHFTSELTALVAALGFAAAGIAFALQNVILAVAGYFSMVAPNGIRVGDRVSLQGPFGYVHGEVIEIGMVRTRLQELAGEPLQPTGRIMVFPNSVVFTGSFIKHPLPGPRHA
jgi:small-conductance mechanosensitive channel